MLGQAGPGVAELEGRGRGEGPAPPGGEGWAVWVLASSAALQVVVMVVKVSSCILP